MSIIPDWLDRSFADEGWILPDGRWVAVPVALAASFVALLVTVKRRA